MTNEPVYHWKWRTKNARHCLKLFSSNVSCSKVTKTWKNQLLAYSPLYIHIYMYIHYTKIVKRVDSVTLVYKRIDFKQFSKVTRKSARHWLPSSPLNIGVVKVTGKWRTIILSLFVHTDLHFYIFLLDFKDDLVLYNVGIQTRIITIPLLLISTSYQCQSSPSSSPSKLYVLTTLKLMLLLTSEVQHEFFAFVLRTLYYRALSWIYKIILGGN